MKLLFVRVALAPRTRSPAAQRSSWWTIGLVLGLRLGVCQVWPGEIFGRPCRAAGAVRQFAEDRALVPEPGAHVVGRFGRGHKAVAALAGFRFGHGPSWGARPW